jgi:hypothetical protein
MIHGSKIGNLIMIRQYPLVALGPLNHATQQLGTHYGALLEDFHIDKTLVEYHAMICLCNVGAVC